MKGDLDLTDAAPRHVGFAPRAQDPLAANCPRHLRRICGTCTHFAGALRDTAPQACARLQITVTAGLGAGKCSQWGRK